MRLHLVIAAVVVVSAATTVPSYAKGNNHHQHNNRNIHSNNHNKTNGQGGIASVYSTDSGSRTAEGGRLNPGALTAAHRSLPFGTKVRVTNNKNGRSVLVTINDRGPFVRGRVIDVTPAAAHALQFSGLTPVNLEVIR